MLKPNSPPPGGLDSLGTLFGRARTEGLAWLQAEVALYRTIAVERASAWKVPAILIAAAIFLAHAALLTLVATLFVGLAQLMNPALAGLLTAVLLAGTAGILGYVALSRIKDSAQ